MTNAEALEVTIAELGRMGRLQPIDEAVLQHARTLAAAVDASPSVGALHQQYADALERLRDDRDAGGIDDLLDELSSSVRDPAET